MKIMVFTEGTLLMPSSGKDVSREERVRQVKEDIPEVNDFGTYIPVGKSIEKLNNWLKQGVEICYLTSRKTPDEIETIQNVLDSNGFPKGTLFYRKDNEEYKDVAERVMPDILIEDDCESIGGEVEMTYPHISSDKKKLIKSIVDKEFSGIDYLPDDLKEMSEYEG